MGLSILITPTTEKTYQSLQQYLLYKKASYLNIVDPAFWRNTPTIMQVNVPKFMSRSSPLEHWLLVPWDEAIQLVTHPIRSTLDKNNIKVQRIVIVTSNGYTSDNDLSMIEKDLKIPMAWITANHPSPSVQGDKHVTKKLSKLFDPKTIPQYEKIDPLDRIKKINQILADENAFSAVLLKSTRRVWFTPIFFISNITLFIVMLINGVSIINPSIQDLLKWGADFAPYTASGQWWRLFSSAFLHIGIIHLAANMICLWDIGHLSERLFGNFRFLMIYIFAAVGGNIASLLFNTPNLVSAGASGAIFGLYGALLGFMLTQKGIVPPAVFRRIGKSTLVFICYNVLYGLQIPHIDNSSHIGGLLMGLLSGALLSRSLPPMTPSFAFRQIASAIALTALLTWGGLQVANKHGGLAQLPQSPLTTQTVLDEYNAYVKQARIYFQELDNIVTELDVSKDDLGKLKNILERAEKAQNELGAILLKNLDIITLRKLVLESFHHIIEALHHQIASLDDPSFEATVTSSLHAYEKSLERFTKRRNLFAQKYGIVFNEK